MKKIIFRSDTDFNQETDPTGFALLGFQNGTLVKKLGGVVTEIEGGGSASSSFITDANNNILVQDFSLNGTTTGANNIALGNCALSCNTYGTNNIALGNFSLNGTTTGGNNIALGNCALSCNQFVVGSSINNAGSVDSEVNTSTQVWNVVINGTAHKILLA